VSIINCPACGEMHDQDRTCAPRVRQALLSVEEELRIKLASAEANLADALADAASWQKQADDRLNDAVEFGRRAEKAEARVMELEGLKCRRVGIGLDGFYAAFVIETKVEPVVGVTTLGDAMPRKDP